MDFRHLCLLCVVQVVTSAMSWSLVQSSLTGYVYLCAIEKQDGGCCATEKKSCV